ncbi:MAG: small basic protein [Planctomycetaceae bacterium]
MLSRDEPHEKMKDEDRWKDGASPLGLPKTRVAKISIGKKKKKKEEEEATPAKGAKGGKGGKK